MSDYNFLSIKKTIKNWYYENFSNMEDIIISKDTKDILIIDFDFRKCLGQLTVSKTNNNPFQYIYFEAVDIDTGNKIYYFFDNENMIQSDVNIALDKAYKYCANYGMSE